MEDTTGKDESISQFAVKSGLEQTLQAGIHGAPELRHEEKTHYLGEYRERVLRMLTRAQVGDPVVYPEIEEALKDPRSAFLVVHGEISGHALVKYKKLAQKYGKTVTARHDDDFTEEAGLVVTARTAVDVAVIEVESRKTLLMRRGLPEQLIDAASEAICKDCYAKVKEAAPEEIKNYQLISSISRLFGEKCPGHE